jgi:hypothetical protein
VIDPHASQDPDFELSPLGCLALLWPAIPDSMVPPQERVWIEWMAAQMPAVPRIALEMRLEADAPAADLHQFISSVEGDVKNLERYLRRNEIAPIFGTDLRDFLLDWAANAGGLRDEIDGLYLEWDQAKGDGLPVAPAIFLPFQGSNGKGRESRRRDAALARAERLQAGGAEALRTGLELLGTHLPDGVSINYLGFMVGRDTPFRVNLRGILPDALPNLLAAISWPGDIDLAARHFGRLVGLADRVVVALDLAPIQPSIGFETILDANLAQEPRWTALFDYLCAEGLCSEEKRAALEALPARLVPEQAGQSWPASWLVAAALSPPYCLPWLERRVSHLKLSIAADGRVGAKAYVSAQHFWTRTSNPPAPRPARAGSSTGLLEQARTDAIAFLLSACGQDDFWRDFRLPNGASDEWVTAFVGWALVPDCDPVTADRIQRSLQALLRRQRPEGGWGYNGFSPPDSDSTAWAARFLEAAGDHGPAAEKARGFLRAHLLTDGGVSTYAPTTAIRFVGKAPAGGDQGWRGSHLCVAANVAAQMDGALSAYLRGAQGLDGSWGAYWWKGDVFSTALAVEALKGDPAATRPIARAVGWARTRSQNAGSAFDRAWLACILMQGAAADKKAARVLSLDLAREQRADGSWTSGAGMLFPDPSQPARDPIGATILDDRRVFTSASVLVALNRTLGAPRK